MKRLAVWLVITGLAAMLFCSGCASSLFRDREAVYGKNPPKIIRSFASDKIRPGDTWKVYLVANDPDDDLDVIVSEIHQPGQGTYPVSYTQLKGEDRKDLSGFVYLNTMTPRGHTWEENKNLTLTIHIRDKGGHQSLPLSFPLSFNSRYVQEPPPPGLFEGRNLGPIMIILRDYSPRG
ncbi:MAG TPA: hypothetical protein VLS90_11990 [Thermodesulfobacteriota bacterium]|nr:hypothetical protein [Thermodesulfobacteriota bacterium]